MPTPLSDVERDHVQTAIFAGRKIEAIKAYREATGEGLKAAKDAVEAIEAELRAEAPDRFMPVTATKAGCLPVLLVLLAPALLAHWWGA